MSSKRPEDDSRIRTHFPEILLPIARLGGKACRTDNDSCKRNPQRSCAKPTSLFIAYVHLSVTVCPLVTGMPPDATRKQNISACFAPFPRKTVSNVSYYSDK